MANRINLNATSYHGAGAIAEIANEAKAHMKNIWIFTISRKKNAKRKCRNWNRKKKI